MRTYNVAFTIAFEVPKCSDPKGEFVKPKEFRKALILRLAELDDIELVEAIGLGFDSYEEIQEEGGE